jgi:hypothetical protein
MEYCSKIIENVAYFGPSPTQSIANKLIQEGVTLFIDLTTNEDKTEPYDVQNKIKYPILDNNIPEDLDDFKNFIRYVVRMVELGEKIYVHCRAGHGRSGLVAACLLCEMKQYSPVHSIKLITEYHGARIIMKDKWRNKTCPNSRLQRNFLKDNFGYSDSYYIINILRRTIIKINEVEMTLENYIMSRPSVNMFDTILMVARNNQLVKNCFLHSKCPFHSKKYTLFILSVTETDELLNAVKKNLF